MNGLYSTLVIIEGCCKHYQLYVGDHNDKLQNVNLNRLGKIKLVRQLIIIIVQSQFRHLVCVRIRTNIVQITTVVPITCTHEQFRVTLLQSRLFIISELKKRVDFSDFKT